MAESAVFAPNPPSQSSEAAAAAPPPSSSSCSSTPPPASQSSGPPPQPAANQAAEQKWKTFADALRHQQSGDLADPPATTDSPASSRNSSGSTLQPDKLDAPHPFEPQPDEVEDEGFEIVSHHKKTRKTLQGPLVAPINNNNNINGKRDERRAGLKSQLQLQRVAHNPHPKEPHNNSATSPRATEPPHNPDHINKNHQLRLEPELKPTSREEPNPTNAKPPAQPTAPAAPVHQEEPEHDASNHSSDSAFAENPSPSHGSSTSLHYAADNENQELSDSVVALSDEEKWPELSVAINPAAAKPPAFGIAAQQAAATGNAVTMASPGAYKKQHSPKSSEHEDDGNAANRRGSKTQWKKVDIEVNYSARHPVSKNGSGRTYSAGQSAAPNNRAKPPPHQQSLDSQRDHHAKREERTDRRPPSNRANFPNGRHDLDNSAPLAQNGKEHGNADRAAMPPRRHTYKPYSSSKLGAVEDDTDDSSQQNSPQVTSRDEPAPQSAREPASQLNGNGAPGYQNGYRENRKFVKNRPPRQSMPIALYPLLYPDPSSMAAVQAQYQAAAQQAAAQQQSQAGLVPNEHAISTAVPAPLHSTQVSQATPTTQSTPTAFIPITQGNFIYNVPASNFFVPLPPSLAHFNAQNQLPHFMQHPMMYQMGMPLRPNGTPQTPVAVQNGLPTVNAPPNGAAPLLHDPGLPMPPPPHALPPQPLLVGNFGAADLFGQLPPTSFLHARHNFGYPITEAAFLFAREVNAVVKKYFPDMTDAVLSDLIKHKETVNKFERADRLTVLKYQLQFYFSPANLPRDFYLRSQMNGDGFVPLSKIASFPRVAMLNLTLPDFVEALQDSEFLELRDTDTNEPLIRTRLNPLAWPTQMQRQQSESAAQPPKAAPVEAQKRRQTIGDELSMDELRDRLMSKARIRSADDPEDESRNADLPDGVEKGANEVFVDGQRVQSDGEDKKDWASVKSKKRSGKKGRPGSRAEPTSP